MEFLVELCEKVKKKPTLMLIKKSQSDEKNKNTEHQQR